MKSTPIHKILGRIRPLSPFHKALYLKGLIASEPCRSIRRRELEALLKDVMNRQLRREAKAA